MGEKYSHIRHFEILLYDKQGALIENEKKRIYSVEYRGQQDTVDVLPYYLKDGKLFIIVTESLRPSLLLRNQITKEMAGIPSHGNDAYIIESPAGYVRPDLGEYSLGSTIERIFKEKLPGLEKQGEPHILGGSYFPSVGSSTELVFPRAALIKSHENYRHESTFAKAYSIAAEDIFNQYFEGKKAISTRLIELIFRLAEEISYNLSIPNDIFEKNLTDHNVEDLAHTENVLSRETFRNILINPNFEKSSVSKVEVRPAETPKVSFLFETHFRGKGLDTAQQEQTLEADLVIRKGIDSVDVGGYFMLNGEMYMPVKWGIRPSILVRNIEPHPLHTDTSGYFIEGIAGSLEKEENKEELLAHATKETEEEVSLQPGGSPLYVGYDYPSAGVNPERVYRVLLPIDPTKEAKRPQPAEETVKVGYAKVTDIVSLAGEGIIRDPRLSLNAHFIASWSGYGTIEKNLKRTPDDFFTALLHKPPEIQSWLSREAGDIDAKLSKSSLYRKLKCFGENELGVTARKLTNEEEEGFFSPMIPLFAVPDISASEKLPFYFLHDLFHYATGGFIPLVSTKEGTGICTLQEYMRAVSGNECEAVWYSDVLIPEEFGLDEAEAIFQGDSVARAFFELRLNREEAREAIRSIELDGKIPPFVLNHPLFGRFRSVFIGRLLRYHVLDNANNVAAHAYWKENLDIALEMEKFCDVFRNVEEYEQYYRNTVERIISYTEGVNPIRAYVSRFLSQDIRLRALKIAYAKHQASKEGDQPTVTRCEELLLELSAYYQELAAIKKKIEHIDPTEENLLAVRGVQEIETSALPDIDRRFEKVVAEGKLSDRAKQALHDRVVPFFESFKTVEGEEMEKTLRELEAAQDPGKLTFFK